MSDTIGEQALADPGISGAAVQGLLFSNVDAGGKNQVEPYPREFVTLGLVVFCLSFWTVVIFSVAG